MNFTPSDTEKLLLSVAGMVARDRRERGVLLNHPESLALLSCWVLERAREGALVTITEPIQVGSHLHLPDANPALGFDRKAAQGFRLDIPSSTSVRFEPGVSKTVGLVALGGRGEVPCLQLLEHKDLPRHERKPRPVVPFGTPGTETETPHVARATRVRLSNETADQVEAKGDEQP